MSKTLYPLNPILLIDDETFALDSIEVILESEGIDNIIKCSDSRFAAKIMEKDRIDLVILDLNMPHIPGEFLLEEFVLNYPKVPVVIITGVDTIESAIECMKKGASDYLIKPVQENTLTSSVKRLLEIRELRRENTTLKKCLLRENLKSPKAFSKFETGSRKIHKIFQYVEAISHSRHPVLIMGETGVGKEIIARSIHKLCCPDKPFIPVNTAGLDDNVFSDTLFGHKKGAFTGAEDSRSGLIDRAGYGILFLDEIGDLNPCNQIKLLRLLQEREYYPLGSDVAKPMDARIIVATHHDIRNLVKSSGFRKDLFYRLNTHQLVIPPLRERTDDISILFDHFLEKAANDLKMEKPDFPDELITFLKSYNFPGNARELESMVYDAVSNHENGILSMEIFEEKTSSDHDGNRVFIPSSKFNDTVKLPEKLPTIDELTAILILAAMKRTNGKQTVAAKLLGISQPALSKRLSKMKLSRN